MFILMTHIPPIGGYGYGWYRPVYNYGFYNPVAAAAYGAQNYTNSIVQGVHNYFNSMVYGTQNYFNSLINSFSPWNRFYGGYNHLPYYYHYPYNQQPGLFLNPNVGGTWFAPNHGYNYWNWAGYTNGFGLNQMANIMDSMYVNVPAYSMPNYLGFATSLMDGMRMNVPQYSGPSPITSLMGLMEGMSVNVPQYSSPSPINFLMGLMDGITVNLPVVPIGDFNMYTLDEYAFGPNRFDNACDLVACNLSTRQQQYTNGDSPIRHLSSA